MNNSPKVHKTEIMSKFSDHSKRKSITPSESLGEVKDQVV